jgi:hypothetical protein
MLLLAHCWQTNVDEEGDYRVKYTSHRNDQHAPHSTSSPRIKQELYLRLGTHTKYMQDWPGAWKVQKYNFCGNLDSPEMPETPLNIMSGRIRAY